MPDGKYIALDGATGAKHLETAALTSVGAGDENSLVQLDADGKIDASFIDATSPTVLRDVVAGEPITAGDLVYISDDVGTPKAYLADQAADAADVVAQTGGAIDETIQVKSQGVINGLTGLTNGAEYFLGVTGGMTTIAPTAPGEIIQFIGIALSPTSIMCEMDDPIYIQ